MGLDNRSLLGRPFIVALVPLLTSAVGAQNVTGELFRFDGGPDARFVGASVAGAGDMNQDGFDDVIVGAPSADPGGIRNAGSVYVYSGRDGTTIWRFHGVALEGLFGSAVAGAGDVNGDGFPDLIVGAAGARQRFGSAFVYSGRDGTIIWQFHGAGFQELLGASVAGAGDVNRDGFADVIVGAPDASPGGRNRAGSAYVYSGKDGAKVWQFDGDVGMPASISGDRLGSAVAGVGDMNRDGFPDLIVGARLAGPGGRIQAGSAYVYSGKHGTRIWQFGGAADQDELGGAVAAAGDVNRDGFPDVIVGPGSGVPCLTPNAGFAIVYSGKDGTPIWEFRNTDPGNLLGSLGCSVAAAGDVNRDGFPDLIVGESSASPDGRLFAGSARVYSGSDGTILWQADGSSRGDHLGVSVAGVGDANGDGFADVIVGATHTEPGGVEAAGTAYVYSAAAPAFMIKYGTALPGSGDLAPMVETGGELPLVGNSNFRIRVTEAVGSSPCVIAGSLTRWDQPTVLGVTLYGDFLTPGGFAQWIQVTSGSAFVPGAGSATVPVPIPDDPTLVGLTTYWQAFVGDDASPSLIGVSHTGGLEITIR